MNQIVECVANFSEGRRMEIIDAIVAGIASVDGVWVIDRHSDSDHNRSVISFVGAPDPILQAAFHGIQAAAQLIDLDQHRGQHPRVGAADVVPFIPLWGVTMADCIQLAQQLGRRVGDELGIPVYLYQAAATRPERENLADIRKGEYEGLKESIGRDPARAPDYGPAIVGKAGAVIIGARTALVAYNVYLTTDNVEIATKISKAIRESSGGLRHVRALGMLVRGRAQVSMNLTDYTRTPVYRVVEMIRREAARYGVGIERSEIVGLIPRQALIDAAHWYLQLDAFENGQILETQLEQIAAAEPETTFLDALAEGTPTPGGGSAAAHSGAMGAALVAMVARVTIGRKKYAAVEARMEAILSEALMLKAQLTQDVQRDADAFEKVMAAFRLPQASDAEQSVRSAAIETATQRATEMQLRIAQASLRVLRLAVEMTANGNANAIADAAVGAHMAHAAIQSALLNVRMNAASIQDIEAVAGWRYDPGQIEDEAALLMTQIRTTLSERGGLHL